MHTYTSEKQRERERMRDYEFPSSITQILTRTVTTQGYEPGTQSRFLTGVAALSHPQCLQDLLE